MTNSEATQRERELAAFGHVVELYSVLKANSAALRVKQAVYRADEVEANPIDFLIDVELKAERLLGSPYYEMFLRTVYNENTEILPEYLRESMGRTFQEYGLGPNGAYAKLYSRVKGAIKLTKEKNFGRLDTGTGSTTNAN